MKVLNQRSEGYAKAVAEYNKAKQAEKERRRYGVTQEPEASRAHTVLYTAPTTQGIKLTWLKRGRFYLRCYEG